MTDELQLDGAPPRRPSLSPRQLAEEFCLMGINLAAQFFVDVVDIVKASGGFDFLGFDEVQPINLILARLPAFDQPSQATSARWTSARGPGDMNIFRWYELGVHLRTCSCSSDEARELVRLIALGIGGVASCGP